MLEARPGIAEAMLAGRAALVGTPGSPSEDRPAVGRPPRRLAVELGRSAGFVAMALDRARFNWRATFWTSGGSCEMSCGSEGHKVSRGLLTATPALAPPEATTA